MPYQIKITALNGRSPTKSDKLILDDSRADALKKLKEINEKINSKELKEISTSIIKLFESKEDLDIKELSEKRENLVNFEPKTNDESNQRIEILKIIFLITSKQLSYSAKNALDYKDTGEEKYPEGHSFFGESSQETLSARCTPILPIPGKDKSVKVTKEDIIKFFEEYTGDYKDLIGASEYAYDLAPAILSEDTIELALLKVEEKTYGDLFSFPVVATHRLGKNSTYKNKDANFEVIFITGTPKNEFDMKSSLFRRCMIQNAINRKYKDKNCKEITVINDPDSLGLEKKIETVAKSCRENNRKLYIFYVGHGGIDLKPQEGVSTENSEKQGGLTYKFLLKKIVDKKRNFGLFENNVLGKDYINIKSLYNKHLSDVETVTVFFTCCGGAGLGFNFLNRLRTIWKA